MPEERMKTCLKCDRILPVDHFSRMRSRSEKRRGTCKQCERNKLKNTGAYNVCDCGRVKRTVSKMCFDCWCDHNSAMSRVAKLCPRCSEKKPVDEFGTRATKTGPKVRNICKKCAAYEKRWRDSRMTAEDLRQRKRAFDRRAKQRMIEDPEYRLRRNRASIRRSCRRLQITDDPESVANKFNMLTVCNICGSAPTDIARLHVDHCHNSGRFRGFLCSSCNTAIGHLQDNPKIIRSAIKYLESFLKNCAGKE